MNALLRSESRSDARLQRGRVGFLKTGSSRCVPAKSSGSEGPGACARPLKTLAYRRQPPVSLALERSGNGALSSSPRYLAVHRIEFLSGRFVRLFLRRLFGLSRCWHRFEAVDRIAQEFFVDSLFDAC